MCSLLLFLGREGCHSWTQAPPRRPVKAAFFKRLGKMSCIYNFSFDSELKKFECRYLRSLNETKLLSDVEKQAVLTMYYPGLDYKKPADMPVHFLYMASSFK